MKQHLQNNHLDNFIKESLLSPGGDLPSVDWNELEILLVRRKPSLSFDISRKQVLLVSVVLFASAGIWGIYEGIRYFRSLPADSITANDTASTGFTVIDTVQQVRTDTAVVPADTSTVDSLAITLHQTDSILKAADAVVLKVNDSQNVIAEKPVVPIEKKVKQKQTKNKSVTVPVDSSAINMPIEFIPPLPDTAGRNRPSEIKPSFSDSSKTPPSSKKSRKGKKGNENSSTQPGPEIPPSRSDSVK